MIAHTDIFLSYSRRDDEQFVWSLYSELQRRGFTVWFDRRSMPNRGLTFAQEIRDAIDAADRLLLVVGPNAVASDYVRSEWEHAILFAKGIVPVLRKGDYSLLPEGLRRVHCLDFRASRNYFGAGRRYRKTLAELFRMLSQPVSPLAELYGGVPALPPNFVQRPALLGLLTGLSGAGNSEAMQTAVRSSTFDGNGGERGHLGCDSSECAGVERSSRLLSQLDLDPTAPNHRRCHQSNVVSARLQRFQPKSAERG